jgi:hypothetical protein
MDGGNVHICVCIDPVELDFLEMPLDAQTVSDPKFASLELM